MNRLFWIVATILAVVLGIAFFAVRYSSKEIFATPPKDTFVWPWQRSD
jgi:hypothetical protein